MRSETADPRPPRRHRPGRRSLAAALAAPALLVGATACASDASDDGASVETEGTGAEAGQFEATAAYLQRAADQSSAEGYRVEMLFSMSGEIDESSAPLMSGEIDGDSYHYVMDMASMMEQMAESMGESMPPEVASLDLTMEMAGDPEDLYMRAPMFAEMGDELGGDASGLVEMGDGWGHVDMAELGEQLPTELASAMGSQGIDPRAVVDIIEGTDDVEDLGTSEVRGDAVHGLSAEVSMAELLEASGQDAGVLAEASGQGVGTEEAIEEVYETPTSIDVWVGDDGYLRRLEFGWSMTDLASALGEDPGELTSLGFGDFRYMIDMYDYGASVDFEPPEDAVDITDAFAALAEG